jgi:hypothetical protein
MLLAPYRPAQKAIWNVDLTSYANIARAGGVLVGAPKVDRAGLHLDGATQYGTFPLTQELNRSALTMEIKFTPEFAADDGAQHFFLDSAPALQCAVLKASGNSLQVYLGGSVLAVALGIYQAYWRQGARNVLLASESGSGRTIYLNGTLVYSTGTHTKSLVTSLILGRRSTGVEFFPGTIHSLSFFDGIWTPDEVTDSYRRQTWQIESRASLFLDMASATKDPSGTYDVTPDKSKHGQLVKLGNGLGTGTPTFQNPGFTFDGSNDYMMLPDIGDPGDKTVVAVLDNRLYAEASRNHIWAKVKNPGFASGKLEHLSLWEKTLTPVQIRELCIKLRKPVTTLDTTGYMVFQTTDITQAWTIRATAGSPYTFLWGDGTSTAGVGNGANQAIAHNYAGAGTYQIRVGLVPADLIVLYCHTNSLTGSIPDLSANVDLVNFWCHTNSLTGSIPDLSANVDLVNFSCNTNSLTGYTASTIAATCTTFNASANALDLAAVDQILVDFTTGAGGRPAAGTINLSGGTNAVPTAAVKNAAVLALPGWSIVTN